MSDRESQPNPFQVLFGIDPEKRRREEMEGQSLLAEVNALMTDLEPRQVYVLMAMVGLAINDPAYGNQMIGQMRGTLMHFHQVNPENGRPYTEGLEV